MHKKLEKQQQCMGNINLIAQKIPFHKSAGDYNILRGNGNANNYFGAGWF
jgi:hypothetical protein